MVAVSASCNPMDCGLPGSSVHGILQARILEWVAISFSRGSFHPRDRTQVSCIEGRLFTVWATRGFLCKERLWLFLFLMEESGAQRCSVGCPISYLQGIAMWAFFNLVLFPYIQNIKRKSRSFGGRKFHSGPGSVTYKLREPGEASRYSGS